MADTAATQDMYFNVQTKTDKQHILDNPDTYIGSVEHVDATLWTVDAVTATTATTTMPNKIVATQMNYVPGLYKLFDEGIVNCRDHVVRMQGNLDKQVPNSLPVTYIDISISDDGTITMTNDGNGMDVVQHPEEKIWVPELIFAHLRTSTNYDKTEKKIVGGKNGFGFKLVLIWSTYGYVETVDHIRGLKYTQEYKDNLDVICPPKITKATKAKPYTKIVFKPDYKRIGLPEGLSTNMVALLQKRVYDISAITDKTIKVRYNGTQVPIKNFEQYINLYIGDKSTTERVYEISNERWEYAVALTPTNEFMQISFVNGINTTKGGKHVEHVLNQILSKLSDYIEKKKKVKVNATAIKEQLMLFLRCDIENPSFDSQTKDYMNTPMNKFGSKCEVSDKFIEKLAKMGVMEAACALTELKDKKAAKKTEGTKSRHINGIPKLLDANLAGSNRSHECILMICEGDSAKTGLLSGLSASDRDTIGIYPLKGKLMNVRGEKIKKISDNNEISDIVKILSLEYDRKYLSMEDIKQRLRYGKVIYVTDQDLDGSHIKGLCINVFETLWPTLIEIPGFLGFMNTPILKATKGKRVLQFYNDGEYSAWKASEPTHATWNIKYYKGLGTSEKHEWIQYFKQKKYVGFQHIPESSNNAIDMIFNKKRSDDRKEWLNKYDRDSYLNTSLTTVSYDDFINKELIHFSKYDCDRNIANLVDGLKISLRKILYCAFRTNFVQQCRVSQFAGEVSKLTLYHHGEASLNSTIVGMAQDFMGSNNINLLVPAGQFGSRLCGGKDAASVRYISTCLEPITRYIFPKEDDAVLKYLEDDGVQVEPQYMVPIIPMLAINGSRGIGTGFSQNVLCHSPKQCIQYLKNKLQNQSELNATFDFVPYYEGFMGTISKLEKDSKRFLFKGVYEIVNNTTIRVTELPIGYWTENFKELLEELSSSSNSDGKKIVPLIKSYVDNCTDTKVDVTIIFTASISSLENSPGDYGCNGLEKLLKLYNTDSNTNMNAFDENDKLVKYETIAELIDDYYEVRLQCYAARKQNQIRELERAILVASNKAGFITQVLNNVLELRNKTNEEIDDMLTANSFDKIDGEFAYLVKMPMNSVSKQNYAQLLAQKASYETQLDKLHKTSLEEIWLSELTALEEEYDIYVETRRQRQLGLIVKKRSRKGNKKVSEDGGEDLDDEDDVDGDDNEEVKPKLKKIKTSGTTTSDTTISVKRVVKKAKV